MVFANHFFSNVQVRCLLLGSIGVFLWGSFHPSEYRRVIHFSGMEWEVKEHRQAEGPGPNYFSDADSSVWVDDAGHLHLRLRKEKGKWLCAEVIGKRPVGLGTLEFNVEGLPKNWDPQCVLGLFTWSTGKSKYHKELDIEYASWGKKKNRWNIQFIVQPHRKKKNKHRFTANIHLPLTHQVLISRKAIAFSTSGSEQPEVRFVVRKRWDSDVPVYPRINLWLYQGTPPTGNDPVEVVLSSFKFLPSP